MLTEKEQYCNVDLSIELSKILSLSRSSYNKGWEVRLSGLHELIVGGRIMSYNVAELSFILSKMYSGLWMTEPYCGIWYARLLDTDTKHTLYRFEAETQADALAKMLIFLIKKRVEVDRIEKTSSPYIKNGVLWYLWHSEYFGVNLLDWHKMRNRPKWEDFNNSFTKIKSPSIYVTDDYLDGKINLKWEVGNKTYVANTSPTVAFSDFDRIDIERLYSISSIKDGFKMYFDHFAHPFGEEQIEGYHMAEKVCKEVHGFECKSLTVYDIFMAFNPYIDNLYSYSDGFTDAFFGTKDDAKYYSDEAYECGYNDSFKICLRYENLKEREINFE